MYKGIGMKKLNLLGSGVDWIEHDSSLETWVAVSVALFIKKKPDRIYHMHDLVSGGFPQHKRTQDIIKMSNIYGIPLHTKGHDDNTKFGICKDYDFLTYPFKSSIDYMMYNAFNEGYDEINIHGVHLYTDTEYAEQLPSFIWWIGFLTGNGVTVNVNTHNAEFNLMMNGVKY